MITKQQNTQVSIANFWPKETPELFTTEKQDLCQITHCVVLSTYSTYSRGIPWHFSDWDFKDTANYDEKFKSKFRLCFRHTQLFQHTFGLGIFSRIINFFLSSRSPPFYKQTAFQTFLSLWQKRFAIQLEELLFKLEIQIFLRFTELVSWFFGSNTVQAKRIKESSTFA